MVEVYLTVADMDLTAWGETDFGGLGLSDP